ncbi:MAG: polysaccharide deacetylase family protein [Candidatus Helarchaeota archaeon]
MALKVALTFDVEKEIFLRRKQHSPGIEKGLPILIDFLNSNKLPATFFVTANLCESHPEIIKESSKKFEIASHGYEHERFSEISEHHEKILKRSKELLENTINKDVKGFRAPFLATSPELFGILVRTGFKYDSSIPTFKKGLKIGQDLGLKEFSPCFSNALLRFPRGFQKLLKAAKQDNLAVLYFHPWEFVNMRKHVSIKDLLTRPDRWIKTGKKFLQLLEKIIAYFQDSGVRFVQLDELI